ncbi:MAG: response regulator transcription factor [Bacteroidia bacterium]|nr:response regulator transcription factor [Bacteroidia bacterium]MCF8425853.1 response regulator transcription factor [Bacteroidia bacterium]MCF8445632.1 response regulator transcription factor [Bacteroidia bacterium]
MKKTLLALDDEMSILKILDFYFNKTYNVVAKQNGKDALEWMQQGVIPDVIIADVNMPEINGLEFIRQIRSSGFFKDVPLIMLSGNEGSSDKIKCLKAGADDYLIKPFNPEELEARIDNIFRRLKKV